MTAGDDENGLAAVVHQVILETDAAAAPRILKAFEEADEPFASAVGMFSLGADRLKSGADLPKAGANLLDPDTGRVEVFAHYELPPSRADLLHLIEAAAPEDKIGPLRIEAIGPADWVTLSQGRRGPVIAGRFFVHGSHDRHRAPSHRYVIEIDAGQAFGTAHHASTRGCLIAFDDLLKRSVPRCILDLGTGSGILAIAAANALKRRVVASDSDGVAVATAAGNARINCALPSIRFINADGLAHPALRRLAPDLVLANLLQRALYDLAPALARRIPSSGSAILSGITGDQAGGIEARYRTYGFIPKSRILLDGWTTLVLSRRSTRPAR